MTLTGAYSALPRRCLAPIISCLIKDTTLLKCLSLRLAPAQILTTETRLVPINILAVVGLFFLLTYNRVLIRSHSHTGRRECKQPLEAISSRRNYRQENHCESSWQEGLCYEVMLIILQWSEFMLILNWCSEVTVTQWKSELGLKGSGSTMKGLSDTVKRQMSLKQMAKDPMGK